MVKLTNLNKSTRASKLKAENVVEEVKQDDNKLAKVLVGIASIGQSNLSEANLRAILGKITVEQNDILEFHLNRLNAQLLSKGECNAIVASVLRPADSKSKVRPIK